jgi:hypothetical protein
MYYTLATARDAVLIAPFLRREDADEARALTGMAPDQAVLASYAVTPECYVIKKDHWPVGLFGKDGHSVWMVGTDRLTSDVTAFLRASKEVMDFMAGNDVVWNYVWTGNSLHIRWLRWLGCEFHETQPLGPKGELFTRFTYVRTSNPHHGRARHCGHGRPASGSGLSR